MSEFIKYFCEHCGQKIGAPLELAGAETPCPACNASTRVPMPGSPTALGVPLSPSPAPGPFAPGAAHAEWGRDAAAPPAPGPDTAGVREARLIAPPGVSPEGPATRTAPSSYVPQLAGPAVAPSPFAVSALVLGVAGLLTAWACVGVLLGPPALVCAALSLGRKEPRRGFAIAGLVLGALATMGGCLSGAVFRA